VNLGDNTQQPYVKRVTLPSGKSIEVLYFAGEPVTASPVSQVPQGTPAEQTAHQPLHVCSDCGSNLVYPTDWHEAGPEQWEVELRCPNCEWRGDGVFHQSVVELFDDELDRGIDVLLSDYRALVNSNMEDEIDRFAKALDAGAILPADF
jgi:DNA-directed RNA polymerase subunit RPC12/RpoP